MSLGPRPRIAVKRGTDLVVAATGLVVLLPVNVAVAVAILLAQGRPILFRQQRPGLNGVPFTIVKFRTMRATQPGEAFYLTDQQRMTRLGRILRSTSIDELPELWNVVKGDMSLVGPRPLLMEYLATYTPRQALRHKMRPGVTGWAVVKGRHTLTFAERLELDVWYVENWSLRLDAKIMLMTAAQLLRRTGVMETQSLADVGFPLPLETGQPPLVRAPDACVVPTPAESGSCRGQGATPPEVQR